MRGDISVILGCKWMLLNPVPLIITEVFLARGQEGRDDGGLREMLYVLRSPKGRGVKSSN